MFGLAIAAMVASVAMIACSKEDAPAPQDEPEFYTVQLGWGGEIVDIAYEPLDTRAAGNDLYGIQVYSKPNNNSTATSWEPYAYGVFDDPTDISIDLASGNKYKFVATMVVDAKNKIANMMDGIGVEEEVRDHYAAPFNVFFDDIGTFISERKNEDIIYSHAWIIDLEGEIHSSHTPNLDRYFGVEEDFVPSSNNTDITITMKRVSFGAKFIVEGALAKSGTLDIQIPEAPKMSLTLTEGEDSISDIFTFFGEGYGGELYACTRDDFSEVMSVSFKWIRPNGTELQIGTFPITFKRNTTTVVTIKMENDVVEGDQTGGVGFSIASSEKGPMPENEDNSVTIVDGEVETGE